MYLYQVIYVRFRVQKTSKLRGYKISTQIFHYIYSCVITNGIHYFCQPVRDDEILYQP